MKILVRVLHGEKDECRRALISLVNPHLPLKVINWRERWLA